MSGLKLSKKIIDYNVFLTSGALVEVSSDNPRHKEIYIIDNIGYNDKIIDVSALVAAQKNLGDFNELTPVVITLSRSKPYIKEIRGSKGDVFFQAIPRDNDYYNLKLRKIKTQANVIVLGTAKKDQIWTSGNKNTKVHGYAGDDKLSASFRGSVIYGDEGNDTIYGGGGNDVLYGDDFFSSYTGSDELLGREGNDILLGGRGNDDLDGGKGNDILHGGKGKDTYKFSDSKFGNDVIIDSDGGKLVFYTQDLGKYTITRKNDNDLFITKQDQISSDEKQTYSTIEISDFFKNEKVFSFVTSDSQLHKLLSLVNGEYKLIAKVYKGTSRDNTLEGSVYADYLKGGSGNNTLQGNKGSDVLVGGTDNDILEGGKGNDTYVFHYNWGKDTIREANNYGDINRIVFTSGKPEEFLVKRENDNLTIYRDKDSTANKITIEKFFNYNMGTKQLDFNFSCKDSKSYGLTSEGYGDKKTYALVQK